MKTSTIISAIARLEEASTALTRGNASIPEQVRLGTECFRVACMLQLELVKACPEIPVGDGK